MSQFYFVLLLFTIPSIAFSQSKLDSVCALYFNAVGGTERIDTILSVKKMSNSVSKTMSYSTTYEMLPYYIRIESEDGTGTFVMVFNEKGRGHSSKGEYQKISSKKLRATIDPAKFVRIAQLNNELKYLGEREMDNKTYYVLSVPAPGDTSRLHYYINTTTGLLDFEFFGEEYEKKSVLSDYKTVNGLQIAFKEQIFHNGVLLFSTFISSIEFNPKLDKSIFYR